jgi:hypothetical protein
MLRSETTPPLGSPSCTERGASLLLTDPRLQPASHVQGQLAQSTAPLEGDNHAMRSCCSLARCRPS